MKQNKTRIKKKNEEKIFDIPIITSTGRKERRKTIS